MSATIRKFSTSTAIVLILSGGVQAADFNERFEGTKPAVSGFNGKLDVSYLHYDADAGGNADGGAVIGSISLPVGHSFGVQVDGGFAHLDVNVGGEVTIGGVALHGFWRDPDVALLGFYGHYANIDGLGASGIDSWRFGIEGELYLDRISLEGFAGADHVSGGGVSDTFFNAEAIAAFYATDDFRIHAGIAHQFEDTVGKIGAELMLPIGGNMTSLYADGTFGDDVTIRAGLRIYFGQSGKSLMARHREDDPRAKITDYFALGGIAGPGGGGGGEEAGGGGGEEGGGCYPYCPS